MREPNAGTGHVDWKVTCEYEEAWPFSVASCPSEQRKVEPPVAKKHNRKAQLAVMLATPRYFYVSRVETPRGRYLRRPQSQTGLYFTVSVLLLNLASRLGTRNIPASIMNGLWVERPRTGGSIFCFLDRSRYFFFQVAPQSFLRFASQKRVPDFLLMCDNAFMSLCTHHALQNELSSEAYKVPSNCQWQAVP
jgi:hypothetical protein